MYSNEISTNAIEFCNRMRYSPLVLKLRFPPLYTLPSEIVTV